MMILFLMYNFFFIGSYILGSCRAKPVQVGLGSRLDFRIRIWVRNLGLGSRTRILSKVPELRTHKHKYMCVLHNIYPVYIISYIQSIYTLITIPNPTLVNWTCTGSVNLQLGNGLGQVWYGAQVVVYLHTIRFNTRPGQLVVRGAHGLGRPEAQPGPARLSWA